MKLACLRCKHKKIKCDKGEPVCHQCITASTECVYVDRKKRPRLAQQKVEVRNLSKRLEFLEKHINSGENVSPSDAQSIEEEDGTPFDPPPLPSPTGPLMTENGQDSWIYRMATDAKRNFEKFEKVNSQCQSTPTDTPTPQIDDAIASLNEALEDLGKLRIRTDECASKGPHTLRLSPEESRTCIQAFVQLVDSMVVPDVFTSVLDLEILRALPDVIQSPFVSIDPGLYVMYYNALYYGLHQIHGPGNPLAQAAYLKVLENVPAWLDAANGYDLDGHTAALTTWTAINNLDYQLSWKFHCKACHFLKMKGVDHLDAFPAKTNDDETKREGLRYLYWQILSTDTLFRLFYRKPAAVRWSPNKVKPPSTFSPNNMKPNAAQVILSVVWIRYTVMTAEALDLMDNRPSRGHGEDVLRKVDDICSELECLVLEWNLENFMKDDRQSPSLSYLFADHIMNIYAVIIGIKRLAHPLSQHNPEDSTALRAARKVVRIILDFNSVQGSPNESKFIFVHFISFYPFCVVFSLYEHVLACPDPDECEDDLCALENIGIVMRQTCSVRKDFTPLSNTINALNKVSRYVQEARRNQSPRLSGEPMETFASHVSSSINGQTSQKTDQQQAQRLQRGVNFPPGTFDDLQDLMNPMDFSGPGFPMIPDFSINPSGDFQPLGFVRALENDWLGRNWHEDNWWDINGDMNVDIPEIPIMHRRH